MSYFVVGLGNPGDEYQGTRHNTGATAVEHFRKIHDFMEWKNEKKINAWLSKGALNRNTVTLLLPQTFMNQSGTVLKSLITSPKKAEMLVVVYDDLDLPLGKLKISFGRNSGGHKGLESVIKSIKTKNFIRLRIGISLKTPKGSIKKATTEQGTKNFVLGKFSPREKEILEQTLKRANEALTSIITGGREKAMNEFNT